LLNCLRPSLYGAIAIQGVAFWFEGILVANGSNDSCGFRLKSNIRAKRKISATKVSPETNFKCGIFFLAWRRVL
jgi:hypothetical protein